MMTGYDPHFLGQDLEIPLPSFSDDLKPSVLSLPGKLRDDVYSDHLNFTIAMNEPLRTLIYSACNIDQSKFKDVDSAKGWALDPNFDGEYQLDNDYYKDRTEFGTKILNPYDRGHMVMRENATWGNTNSQAVAAGKATYVYSNAALQHMNLNKDEWKALELEIVNKFQHAEDQRLTVFTGPIYGDLDRHINLSDTNSARVPSGFFKVICFRRKHAQHAFELGVLTFAIFQDESVIRDRHGSSTVKTNRNYQITISELQQLTGINFGQKLYDANPLFITENELRNAERNVHRLPERIPVNTSWDVIPTEDTMRVDVTEICERKIVIQSAMINPLGNESRKNNEWVSLFNRSSRSCNIDGWVLSDQKGRDTILTGRVRSGESLKVAGKSLRPVELTNTGGWMMLYNKDWNVVDHVSWSRNEVNTAGEGLALTFR